MAKIWNYKGKTLEELKAMQLSELAKLLPARQRRTLIRGIGEIHKKFLEKVYTYIEGKRKKPVRTQLRDMIILPSMVGALVQVHNGHHYENVQISEDMIGHYLGEFVMTRKPVKHSGPGVGATRGSKHISVK